MPVTFEQLAVDCADVQAQAAFWAGVFQTEVDAGGNEFMATVNRSGGGPAMMFLQVPEKPSGVKNRLHLDLGSGDWAADVDRIVALGAKREGEFNEYGTHWITLVDPEGNVFDLAEAH
ncbi:VOC family protein [Kribbella sp. NPDC051770]|uniref:VOC family protein n=1 Tax=Kribbella sp. NPDC051770 TaxID=3155413 RepID=UPI00343D9433